ncbi:unnamed protein product [Phytomonas sp. Hart1]|nr:unnamed protein product [Phytomonas sp. Hart1]|eukprot:CCW67048.1 unnamed protein product [Phytomonas sp. isolate Hart1]
MPTKRSWRAALATVVAVAVVGVRGVAVVRDVDAVRAVVAGVVGAEGLAANAPTTAPPRTKTSRPLPLSSSKRELLHNSVPSSIQKLLGIIFI